MCAFLCVCVYVSKVRGSHLGDFLNCLHLIFETESDLNLDSPDQLDWRTDLSNRSAVIAQCRDALTQDFLLGCENELKSSRLCESTWPMSHLPSPLATAFSTRLRLGNILAGRCVIPTIRGHAFSSHRVEL